MPHLELGGDVSIFYDFPHGADSSKPSVVLLAPSFLNATFLKPYVDALSEAYSCCTIELRGQGRTTGGASPYYDYFVAAADLAFVMDALHLPPSHILAPGITAFRTALDFAILFPDQALSFSFVGASSLFGAPRNAAAFEEVDTIWGTCDDTDLWVECIGAVGEYLFTTEEGREQVWDTALPSIARRYNPYRPEDIFISTKPNHKVDSRITPALLAQIKQPILLIHGDRDLCFPIEDVRELQRCFASSEDVRFHVEPDAPQLVAITHTDTVIPRVRSFLDDHRGRTRPYEPLDKRAALRRAAAVAPDVDLSSRDPLQSDSFSLVSSLEREKNRLLWDKTTTHARSLQAVMPMCFEREDWEKGAEEERRWTWTGRNDYAQQHYARRPSSQLASGDGIVTVVEVTESRGAIPNGVTGARSTSVESRRSSTEANIAADGTSAPVEALAALRVSE
ncbi:hypothetical protein JCM8202_003684 [Rhodotorula sphaerocarpa]